MKVYGKIEHKLTQGVFSQVDISIHNSQHGSEDDFMVVPIMKTRQFHHALQSNALTPKRASSHPKNPITLKKVIHSVACGYALAYGSFFLPKVRGQVLLGPLLGDIGGGNLAGATSRNEPEEIKKPDLEDLLIHMGGAGMAGVGVGLRVFGGPGGMALGGLIGVYAGLGPTLVRMHEQGQRSLDEATEAAKEMHSDFDNYYDRESGDENDRWVDLPASREHDADYERPDTMNC